jgi:predicted lipoprotein with Yx(FWY)xxD motif
MDMVDIGGGGGTDRRLNRCATRGLLAAALLALALLALPGAASALVLYPPIAGAANRTATGFELTGTVYNYSGATADTTYHFEYGTTTAYGTSAPMPDADAGSGLATRVTQTISGLAPNTTYHFRLVSTNTVEGTQMSADREFSTAETTSTTPPTGTAPGTGAGTGTGAYPGTGSYPGYPGESAGGGAPTVGGKGPKTVAKAVKSGGKTLLAATNGHTLYSLSAETHGKFICTASSGCTQLWHPLTVAAGVVPKGPVKLGTVKRPEGAIQVTYKGRPLYTFASDKKPGQTKGEGFKDVGTWHAALVPAKAMH